MKKSISIASALLAVFTTFSCGNSTSSQAVTASGPVVIETGNPDAGPAAEVKEIETAEEFASKVLEFSEEGPIVSKNDCLAVVDFFATWCGPCRQLSPIVEEVCAEYAGKVSFFKVDVDKVPEAAEMFGISSIPVLLYLAPDGTLDGTMGLVGKDEILAKIEEMIVSE